VSADLRIGGGSAGAPECQQERLHVMSSIRQPRQAIAAHPFVKVSWPPAQIDLKDRRPVLTTSTTRPSGETVEI